MKLKVAKGLGDKPLSELSESQQKRFIQKLQDESIKHDIRFGIEIALIMMGYEISDEN